MLVWFLLFLLAGNNAGLLQEPNHLASLRQSDNYSHLTHSPGLSNFPSGQLAQSSRVLSDGANEKGDNSGGLEIIIENTGEIEHTGRSQAESPARPQESSASVHPNLESSSDGSAQLSIATPSMMRTHSNQSQLQCPICLVDFPKSEGYKFPTCVHLFHKECIEQWMALAVHNEGDITACPFCRETLPPELNPLIVHTEATNSATSQGIAPRRTMNVIIRPVNNNVQAETLLPTPVRCLLQGAIWVLMVLILLEIFRLWATPS